MSSVCIFSNLISTKIYSLIDTVGMLGHSISIILTIDAHFIPTMQDQVARIMAEILTPIPIELESKS